MEAKHTPGPWKAVDVRDARNNPSGYAVWQDIERPFSDSPRGNKICATPDGTTPQNKANAALIAAAPELLEALEMLVVTDNDKSCPYCTKTEWGEEKHDEDCVYHRAYKIIAKARGENQ